MKRLVIIAEGDTEESFVNNILSPHFNSLGLYNDIQCFKIKKSNGGFLRQNKINIRPLALLIFFRGSQGTVHQD